MKLRLESEPVSVMVLPWDELKQRDSGRQVLAGNVSVMVLPWDELKLGGQCVIALNRSRSSDGFAVG